MMPTLAKPATQTLTTLLSHLVRMPTISSDTATNAAALDWVEEQLRGLPLAIKRYEHNGHPSLVATAPKVKNPKNPRLWLMGHIDVVPGAPSDFEPKIRGTKLHGRGVFDMKYALAIYLHLLQDLGPDLAKYDLGLMLVSDEELGGIDGAKYLADLGYAGQAMLLPECGTSWSQEIGAKGINWWKLTATGHASHAARPWEGANAIDQLYRYIERIRSHFPTEPCGDNRHVHNTFNVGTITGGAATNQIADHAEATLDIRVLPSTPLTEVGSWFKKAAITIPSVTATNLIHDPGFNTPDKAAAQLFRQLTTEITGRQLTTTFAHASSDARFFVPKGTQVITVPTTGGGQHSPEEWIDLIDLERYYEIVRRFVDEWVLKTR